MTKKELGSKLKFFRKELGLSQTKLSRKVCIPQTTISDFENGRYFPDVYQAVRLASALQISIYDLIPRRSEKVG